MNPAESTLSPVPLDGNASLKPVRRRVLVVDDDESMRDLLHAFFASRGDDVHLVDDGRHVAPWLAANTPDLIVTDLCMPGIDGMELLVHLRRMHSTVPVIVMSGGVGGEMAGMLRAAELLGARRTLAKPFSLPDLKAVVHAVLDS